MYVERTSTFDILIDSTAPSSFYSQINLPLVLDVVAIFIQEELHLLLVEERNKEMIIPQLCSMMSTSPQRQRLILAAPSPSVNSRTSKLSPTLDLWLGFFPNFRPVMEL